MPTHAVDRPLGGDSDSAKMGNRNPAPVTIVVTSSTLSSICTRTLICALSTLTVTANGREVSDPAVHGALVDIVNELLRTDLDASNLTAVLSRQTGAAFERGLRGTSQMRSGPARLAGGLAVGSIEVTQKPGVLSRVIITVPDAPCIDAKVLAAALHANAIGSGGLPSPRSTDSPAPGRTFYTGEYSGVRGNRTMRVGFKHWLPDDTVCVSSLVVEQ